jgi:hypothetical protein
LTSIGTSRDGSRPDVGRELCHEPGSATPLGWPEVIGALV